MQRFGQLRNVALRHAKGHCGGLHLRHHHDAGGIGGLHHITGIDQTQTDASADWRGDARILDIQFGAGDLRFISGDRTFVLADGGGLGIEILAR